MWPLLLCSLITVATVAERLAFSFRERRRREPAVVEQILQQVDLHDADGAMKLGQDSGDFVARTLVYALEHRGESFPAPCCARPTRS